MLIFEPNIQPNFQPNLANLVKIAASALLAIVLAGCAAPPIKIPMDRFEYPAQAGQQSKNLLILMAGAGDRHDAFQKYGYIDEAKKANLNADIWAVDAHYGYFTELTIRERLHLDVVLPAKAKGYECIWMGGISLGGFGSLIYQQKHPTELTGLVLIAPYIGNKGTMAEIEAAGGLDSWSPTNIPEHDERNLWLMLKQYRPNITLTASLPPIYLLYGKDDRFAAFHRMLDTRLDRKYVNAVEGGHDWLPWQQVWREFVASKPFDQSCGK